MDNRQALINEIETLPINMVEDIFRYVLQRKAKTEDSGVAAEFEKTWGRLVGMFADSGMSTEKYFAQKQFDKELEP